MEPWVWVLVALAAVKIAAALPGFAFLSLSPDAESPFPAWLYAAQVAIFSAFGTILVAGGRRDRRAQLLGSVFLVAASLFANRPLQSVPVSAPSWVIAAAAILRGIEPGAFRSLLVWMFASAFPRSALTGGWRRVAIAGQMLAGTLGAILFASSLVQLWLRFQPGTPGVISWLPAGTWPLNTLLTLAALPLIVVNARAAGVTERRRVRLFVWALVLGTGPILLEATLESLVPAYGLRMSAPTPRFWTGVVFYSFLWVGLAVAAYSVYATHVLSVRLVIRQAIRYALARATILTFITVPFVAASVFLYTERGRSLNELLTGGRQLMLLGLVVAGLVLLRVRPRLLDALDRRFFREKYDARRILGDLIETTRDAQTVGSLADRLSAEIDRALHVGAVHLFVSERDGRQFVPVGHGGRPLRADFTLLTLLRGGPDPMDVDLHDARAPLQRLPSVERGWLADGAYRLLVPVHSRDGELLGVMALGPKRSELPFSGGDRWLLTAIAASAAVAIESITIRSAPSRDAAIRHEPMVAGPAGDAAFECGACFLVHPAGGACRSCGGALRQAPVPEVLRCFRLERRIGVGGMGVVYRAIDTELERLVAIKTLPRLSPADADRLRREARAMASVAHPNLATIYAVEMWREQPLLIVEYFADGTLRDRLRQGRLSAEQALTLGADLLAGLEHMHQLGLLHRDIKPSNIAYGAAGRAKLLDFGLARLAPKSALFDTNSTTSRGATRMAPAAFDTSAGLAGTPLYFSPELLDGNAPDKRADLWALALVLYEAIAGSHPFGALASFEAFERIRGAGVPDIRETQPECPAVVAAYFLRALHAEPERRPGTASQFAADLRQLARALGQAAQV